MVQSKGKRSIAGIPSDLVISFNLLEHDETNAERYRKEISWALEQGFNQVTITLRSLPGVADVLADVGGPALDVPKTPATAFVEGALDFDSELMFQQNVIPAAKDLAVIAARTPRSAEQTVPFKRQVTGFNRHGAAYQIMLTAEAN